VPIDAIHPIAEWQPIYAVLVSAYDTHLISMDVLKGFSCAMAHYFFRAGSMHIYCPDDLKYIRNENACVLSAITAGAMLREVTFDTLHHNLLGTGMLDSRAALLLSIRHSTSRSCTPSGTTTHISTFPSFSCGLSSRKTAKNDLTTPVVLAPMRFTMLLHPSWLLPLLC
jgi:hypothetical protein